MAFVIVVAAFMTLVAGIGADQEGYLGGGTAEQVE